jgi:aminoglycoside 6'-N-acetyltransferase I
MNVQIKKTASENLGNLAKIYSEEFSKSPYNEPWTKEKAMQKLKIFSNYCDIWSIFYEQQLVGFIVINPSQWFPGEIAFGEEIAIKADMQNKGIGKQVFEQIFEIYKKRGFKTFMGIVNKKAKAKNLYNQITNESKDNFVIERSLQ